MRGTVFLYTQHLCPEIFFQTAFIFIKISSEESMPRSIFSAPFYATQLNISNGKFHSKQLDQQHKEQNKERPNIRYAPVNQAQGPNQNFIEDLENNPVHETFLLNQQPTYPHTPQAIHGNKLRRALLLTGAALLTIGGSAAAIKLIRENRSTTDNTNTALDASLDAMSDPIAAALKSAPDIFSSSNTTNNATSFNQTEHHRPVTRTSPGPITTTVKTKRPTAKASKLPFNQEEINKAQKKAASILANRQRVEALGKPFPPSSIRKSCTPEGMQTIAGRYDCVFKIAADKTASSSVPIIDAIKGSVLDFPKKQNNTFFIPARITPELTANFAGRQPYVQEALLPHQDFSPIPLSEPMRALTRSVMQFFSEHTNFFFTEIFDPAQQGQADVTITGTHLDPYTLGVTVPPAIGLRHNIAHDDSLGQMNFNDAKIEIDQRIEAFINNGYQGQKCLIALDESKLPSEFEDGSLARSLFIHELLHALGLVDSSHMGKSGQAFDDTDLNTKEVTNMATTQLDEFSRLPEQQNARYPSTPSPVDFAALENIFTQHIQPMLNESDTQLLKDKSPYQGHTVFNFFTEGNRILLQVVDTRPEGTVTTNKDITGLRGLVQLTVNDNMKKNTFKLDGIKGEVTADIRNGGWTILKKDALECRKTFGAKRCIDGNVGIAYAIDGKPHIVNVETGDHNDRIIGNDADNIIKPGLGENFIFPKGGRDHIFIEEKTEAAESKNIIDGFEAGPHGDTLVFKQTIVESFEELQSCMQDVPIGGHCFIDTGKAKIILLNFRCTDMTEDNIEIQETLPSANESTENPMASPTNGSIKHSTRTHA